MKRQVNAISFTPKYDALEDRIRISINYNDIKNRIDLMLSRAFIIKLFPVIDEYMFKYYELDLGSQTQVKTQKNTQNQTNESVENNINKTNTTSQTDGTDLELYKQEDELLIELKFSYNEKTKMSVIQFHSRTSVAIAHLDENSIKQVFTILKSVIPFFSWGISHHI